MLRRPIIPFLLILFAAVTPSSAYLSDGPEDLSAVIAPFEDGKASIGVSVYAFARRRTVFEHNPHLPLNPASTMKLVTTLAGLKYLGPDYTFATFLTTDQYSGSKIGNLYIKGIGDPTLTEERFYRMAGKLFAMGVNEISGDVVIDNSHFATDPQLADGLRRHMTANAAFVINPYSASVNMIYGEGQKLAKLGAGANRFELQAYRKLQLKAHPPAKTKAQALTERKADQARQRALNRLPPAMAAGEILREALQKSGIRVRGVVRVDSADAGTIVLAQDVSEPLASILLAVNKKSNNFVAEMLLKGLSARELGAPGSTQKGAALLTTLLSGLDVPSADFHVANGSGLSRENRLSAAAITRVLVAVAADASVREPFVTSLSVAGLDGTLKKRMRGTVLAGAVRGKTGTLRDTVALAGYLKAHSGKILAFSIIVNNPAGAGAKYYPLQEQLLAALYAAY